MRYRGPIVDIPSDPLRPADTITISGKMTRSRQMATSAGRGAIPPPAYLELDATHRRALLR